LVVSFVLFCFDWLVAWTCMGFCMVSRPCIDEPLFGVFNLSWLLLRRVLLANAFHVPAWKGSWVAVGFSLVGGCMVRWWDVLALML
jgi:hypothetical protein